MLEGMQFRSLGPWLQKSVPMQPSEMLMSSSWRKGFCLIFKAGKKDKLNIQVITGLYV